MSENIFRDPAFARFLMSMGAGMMGQPTLGKGLTSGMQAGVMSYMNDMTDEEKRKHQQQLLKDEQQGRLSLLNTEYGYKNQAAQDEASSKQERLKIAGSAIAAQAEASGVQFSPLFKAALEAGDETAIKSGQDAIDRNEKAKIDVTVKGMDRAADNSEFDRRFSIQNPGGVETPEQKAAREQQLWSARNNITSQQQQDLEREKQKTQMEMFLGQNKITHDQARADKLSDAGKERAISDQSEIDTLSDTNNQLEELAKLQKVTATGPIMGTDTAVTLRKILPGGDNITKLEAGYNTQLAKMMELWKGNPTPDERRFMEKAKANITNNEGPNLDLLAQAKSLNDARIKRIKGRMSSYNLDVPGVDSGGTRPGYVPFRMGK